MEPPPPPLDAALPPLPALPRAVVHAIFALLPADTRLRCSEVCRGWRAALLDPPYWTHVDLRRTTGVRLDCAHRAAAVLRAATARAAGAMQALDTAGFQLPFLHEVLNAVTASAASLRRLRVCHGIDRGFDPQDTDLFFPRGLHSGAAEELLQAAPRLDAFDADVGFDDGPQALTAALRRTEPRFGPLRVRRLELCMQHGPAWQPMERDTAEAEGIVATLASDLAACDMLTELRLKSAPLARPGRFEAIVDALLTHGGRVRALALYNCTLPPPEAGSGADALSRLIAAPSGLNELHIDSGENVTPPADAPGVRALAAALASSSTLTSLTLDWRRFWVTEDTCLLLLRALVGHVSLRALALGRHAYTGDGAASAAVCEALGALVAANAPALTQLDLSGCHLRDAGLAPLCEALRVNSHLRELSLEDDGDVSETFARYVLLPAVRANESLRQLHAWGEEGVEQAVALVESRSA
jgi:hypothetical protein